MNELYSIVPAGQSLSHHGILGMKWGVRRFQDKTGRLTAAGRKRLGYSVERAKKTVKDPEFQRKAKKAAIVAGVTAATVLAAYGAYKFAGSAAGKKTIAKGSAIVSSIVSDGKSTAVTGIQKAKNTIAPYAQNESQLMRKNKSDTFATEFNKTNPDLRMSNKELTNYYKNPLKQLNPIERSKHIMDVADGNLGNCAMNTTAMEMRKRGYDVTAGKSRTGYTQMEMERWWKGGKHEACDPNGKIAFRLPNETTKQYMLRSAELRNRSISNVDAMLKKDNNTSGYLAVRSMRGGGHSIAYEVNNGKVRIFDGQVRKSYNSTQQFFNENPGWAPQATMKMRTDNLEPNIDVMLKDHIIRNNNGVRQRNVGREVTSLMTDKVLLGEAGATVLTGKKIKDEIDDRNYERYKKKEGGNKNGKRTTS